MPPILQADPPPLRVDETGTIRIGESQILLEVIVREYEEGADPESIASAYPPLQVAEVYAAIAYYLRHRSELDAYLRRREEQAAKLRQEIEARHKGRADLRRRLEARRAQQEPGHASSGD